MKLSRLYLPNAPFVGALARSLQSIDAKRDGCSIDLDDRTGMVSIVKGPAASILLPSGAIADVADVQEDANAGAPSGLAPTAPRRGRPPKNPPPVQG
jgi:hypothetical protein